MITIISGTNRPNSNTLKIANVYKKVFQSNNIEVNVLDLEWLQSTVRTDAFTKIESEMLIPTSKFLIISPEYNGTFPGVLKLLMDISDIKQVWHGKKAMLVGVASGRAGNIRGMDHLTNVLNHLQITVSANKLPISAVHQELDEAGNLVKEQTQTLIENQVKAFINF